MRRLALLMLLGCAGPKPPPLTAAEAQLLPDQLVTPRMCGLLVDRVFDMVSVRLGPHTPTRHDAAAARSRKLDADRARLKQPDELAACAGRYNRWNYDCAIRAETTDKVKDCLPGMTWIGD